MDVRLNVNGFDVNAHFDDESVHSVLLPLLRELTKRQKKANRRLVALLAAPPGAGKSTLAAALEQLSRAESDLTPVQALGMDGFHFHQDYILSHSIFRNGEEIPMHRIKGAPESFDVQKLRRALEEIQSPAARWPYYDRRLHDVVEDAVEITAPILLAEGNWLLLDAPQWHDLPADFRIFIDAEKALLRNRLIARKQRGGASHAEAESHFAQCDGPNIRLCREKHIPADLILTMTADGTYLKGA